MSDNCCCPPGSTGGGIAAIAALAGFGIFIWLNIMAIVTFLLLAIAGAVALAIAGLGGILFLRRFIVPRWSNGRMLVRDGRVSYELGPAAADIMPQTRLRRPQALQLEAEVLDDGLVRQGLESGSQGRTGAIHARAQGAALSPHESFPGDWSEGQAARSESGTLHHWL